MLSVKKPVDCRHAGRDFGILSDCSSLVKHSICIFLLVGFTGCSLTSEKSALNSDLLVTNSVTKPVVKQGVEDTDAEVIKKVVSVSDQKSLQTSELAWTNPDTGHSGTIVAIEKFVGSHGQKCKKFQTTVDNFRGVAIYDGETCEVNSDLWVLSWFTRRQDG